MSWHIARKRRILIAGLHFPPAAVEGVKHAAVTIRGVPLTFFKHNYRTWRTLRSRGLLPPSPLCYYDWPGRFKPMRHQVETVEHFILHDRCFCLDGLGTGKTAAAVWAADYLQSIGEVRRVLIVAPLSITEHVWERELFLSMPHRRPVVLKGTRAQKAEMAEDTRNEIIIINPESLHLLGKLPEVDLIIVDECFPAGTPIQTPQGAVPIERLQEGQEVLTDTGPRRIMSVGSRTVDSSQLVTVRLADGKTITCTAGHPFFTDAGWLPARLLKDHYVYNDDQMRLLWDRLRDPHVDAELQASQRYRAMLLSLLCEKEAMAGESAMEGAGSCDDEATLGKYGNDLEQGPPLVQGMAGKEVGAGEGTWYTTAGTRMQRSWNDGMRNFTGSAPAFGVYMELCGTVGRKAAWLSYLLQSGLWKPGKEDSDRSGRPEPQNGFGAVPGLQERCQIEGTRVGSVSYHERGSKTQVFNIEVEGVHRFYANDLLVHNCTKFKNHRSRRYKALKRIAEGRRLWLMSGTPAPQAPTDAYAPVRLVNPRKISFMAFRDMTMKKVSQFKWVAKPEADQVIAQWMQPAIRHAREDCFELPDVQTLELHADMTKHQRDLVKTLTDEARAILADGQEITAANAAAVLTKILQVEAGGIYDADHEVHRVDAKPYFEAIEGVLDQADTPVLIFVNFRSSAQATADYLEQKGFRIGRVLGGSRERAALFDAFQAGELDAIVAVPSTMSHGLTLTRSRIVVWASPPFSFETYEQANGRVIRRGQKNNVLIYHLVQTSLDKDLFSRLESRQRLQEAVLNLLTSKEVTK